MSILFEPLPIEGRLKETPWGKPADDALAARMSAVSPETDALYGELWYGAHIARPSFAGFRGDTRSLKDLIDAYPEQILGASVVQRFGPELPFLFKALSIGSALSIQLHPSREEAEKLHASNATLYPDSNHKPEIAIAVSEFSLLRGFRPTSEIKTFADTYPAFASCLSDDTKRLLNNSSDKEATLRAVFEDIMTAEDSFICERSIELAQGIQQAGATSLEEELIIETFGKFPSGDRGLFCFLVMQLAVLQPGQAVFTDAHVPHAYIKGDIVECMANSDNVIRAGLTPKHRDIDTLLRLAHYSSDSISVLEGLPGPDSLVLYPTPAEEFKVSALRGSGTVAINEKRKGLTLLVLVDGVADVQSASTQWDFEPGMALLIPAGFTEVVSLTLTDGLLFTVSIPEVR